METINYNVKWHHTDVFTHIFSTVVFNQPFIKEYSCTTKEQASVLFRIELEKHKAEMLGENYYDDYQDELGRS